VASLVRFRAQDGYELVGSLHAPSTEREASRVAVVHCGAGIPAARYERFAAFLAHAGTPTLTYDYRGIGRSRPAALRGFSATMEDWAQYDCAAAIGWLRARFPATKMTGIAHSIGCLLVGGADNAAEQARLVMIGGHTGYYRDYRRRYRLQMALVWHILMPAVTRLVGYFPGRRLGLGEDIPARSALQWAARRSPELRPAGKGADDVRTQRLLDRCAALQRPALLVSISDDAFATPIGMERLMSYYPGLSPLWRLRFTPADAGVRRIGHFGFFTRRAGPLLWPRLLAELETIPA
jgi:predicted alpha/beta hydrolase